MIRIWHIWKTAENTLELVLKYDLKHMPENFSGITLKNDNRLLLEFSSQPNSNSRKDYRINDFEF